MIYNVVFFFQAEDGIRDKLVTGVQTCALPISWGPDCERVHDNFDQIAVLRDLEQKDDNVIMTTWHSDESLEEGVWFLVNCAFPTQAYEESCKAWIVAPIGNAEWEQRIRAAFEAAGECSASKTESA